MDGGAVFSREERILAEILVSRGHLTPEALEAVERVLPPGHGLEEQLASAAAIDPRSVRALAEEVRAIERSIVEGLPASGRLGEFRLVREIGRGGMGVVFEAIETPLDRRVALKILPRGAAFDALLAERFQREMRAATQVKHPGIVPLLASGCDQGIPYFAMEYVEGGSLEHRVSSGPQAPRIAARLIADAARGVAAAHGAGLIHRDIKPSNILVGADGHARIADFGLVHAAGDVSLTGTATVLGTPAYIAPEQARGESAAPAEDVYALGAVLYALLAGHAPYPGEIPSVVLCRVLREDPPDIARVARDVPPHLAAIVRRAMARVPARRYPSASALADDLDRFVAGQPTAAGRARARRRRRLIAAAGAGVLAGLLCAAEIVRLAVPRPAVPGPRFAKSVDVALGPLRGQAAGPRIAWTGRRYAAAWPAPHGALLVAFLDPDGRFTAAPWALDDVGAPDEPALAPLGSRVAIVWSNASAGETDGLRIAVVDDDGHARAALSVGSGHPRRPQIAAATDRFGVVWERPGRCGADVLFGEVDAEGTRLRGGDALVHCADQPAIAWDGSAFLVVWHALTDDYVYLARVAPGGRRIAGPVPVNRIGPADRPAIAADAAGCGIAWHFVRWGKDWVFFRRFGLDLRPLIDHRLAGNEGAVDSGLACCGDVCGLAFDTPLFDPPSDVGFFVLDRDGQRSHRTLVSESPGVASLDPALACEGRAFGIVWSESAQLDRFRTVRFVRLVPPADRDAGPVAGSSGGVP